MQTRNLSFLLLAGLLGACASSSSEDAASVETVRSALERDTTPDLTTAEQETLARGEAEFAVDIFRAVAGSADATGKDVFLSPHSISIALGMTYAGARGETAAEMKKALRLELPEDRVHAGFNHLDLALSSRGKGASGKDGKPFRLNVANALWSQKGTPFEAPFLDTLAVSYGAGINVVDFGDTEATRGTINGWVEEKTEDRIKDLIPQGGIDASTRFVLVNAVYFNAAWAQKFIDGGTTDAPFTRLDGTSTTAAMMHGQERRPYLKGEGFEAVELPYEGGELSMLVIAPTAGTYPSFEGGLTGAKVLDILGGLQSKEVNLSFPKHELEGAFGLKAPLVSLGMKKAFEDADFSGISKSASLVVDDVLHKTFLSVDENGTEAAAATAVVGRETSASVDPPVEMKVDRPFIEAIVDRQTRTLIFVGRILEPKTR